MRPSIQLFALLLTPLLSSAQNFVPSSASGNFPACAASCALLQQAQSTCLTQTGQQTSGLAAENCFCQTAFLQALYTTPDAICVAECPNQPDRVNLRTWFTSFCAQVGQGVDPNGATNAAGTTTVTQTSTSTNGPTSTAGTAVTGQQNSSSSNKPWIETHWKWIVMVVALAIGLGGLAWLLIWLRNRHRRNVDERRAHLGGFPTEREKAAGARAATPELWGPHQHMHATKGWEYNENPAAVVPNDRRDGRSRAERPERGERRHSSHRRAAHKPGSTTRLPASELEEPRSMAAKRPSSNRRSKHNPDEIEAYRDSSRSRTRKNRGSKYDFDRDVEGR